MTRLGTDGLPSSKTWGQITVETDGAPGESLPFQQSPLNCEKAIMRASADNADAVSFGPTVDADFGQLAPGEEYLIQGPPETRFDLSVWYAKSDTSAQVLEVIYI